MNETAQPSGPDLKEGILETDLPDGGMLVGHVDDEAVLVARRNDEIFAVGATCTHYNGPLGEGLMVGETIRCPWHHACFSLRTGEALAAPAFAPISCWRVERRDNRIFVHGRLTEGAQPVRRASLTRDDKGARMAIIGGGAAGYAAANMLRREGFGGDVTIISADPSAPYDRPNLSKDFLSGSAPQDWLPLAGADTYKENRIELLLDAPASEIDVLSHRVKLKNGASIPYTKLLLATGAEPIRLNAPGAESPHVRTLRSLADCRQIIDRAKDGSRAIVVGASFIGLETAAALRQRGVQVDVIAPESRPMERVFGPAFGDFIRELHESHGVRFRLGHTVSRIDGRRAELDDGTLVEADLVLVGIGVRPRLDLAEKAGLATDRGVLVNQYLETSAADVFAAGDIARWPDPYSGERLRVEHWVVAERQGQTAARNMLGGREPYGAVPFFWTQQYDVTIDYLGHAAAWDRIEQNGQLDSRDVALCFRKGDRTLAFATIFRGQESLKAEVAMEEGRSP